MKNYQVAKENGRYTIGERVNDFYITNDGICGYYWWNTREAAQAAADAYNVYAGQEWLGQRGYGNDRIDESELVDYAPEMVELYRLFNAIDEEERK